MQISNYLRNSSSSLSSVFCPLQRHCPRPIYILQTLCS
uniref:Uncharacterized protein n=1 Tax=Anguilla anguilla TaxID=7936 RepID=A0A0E9R597_ANGAN